MDFDDWKTLQQEFWTAEAGLTVTVDTLNGRVTSVQYWKDGIPVSPSKLLTVAALAGDLLLRKPMDGINGETLATRDSAQRWWRYLAYDLNRTKSGPRDKGFPSSDGSHLWSTLSIVGANFESSIVCKSLADAVEEPAAPSIEPQPEQVATVDDDDENADKLAWHSESETPPGTFAYGPLTGQKKTLAQIFDTDPRSLFRKLGAARWGRKENRTRYSIWFTSKTEFEKLSLLLSQKSSNGTKKH